jgi:hypothetical protein
MDVDGTTYVIELKRGVTPREVIAQLLDYGAWVRGLSAEQLTRIFETSEHAHGRTFQTAFAEVLGTEPPETINETHRLVVVASELDESTQRIVEYLLDAYGVPVNAVFFKYFRGSEAEYLGRSWLRDPQIADELARVREPKRTPSEWNGGDYYVLFGHDARRSWEDARAWGYVSAGGGMRWSRPLHRLQPGARVFVHHPPDGYVGVGRVLEPALPIADFTVTSEGRKVPLIDIPLHNDHIKDDADDPERSEYLVPVHWEWAVPVGDGFWVKGFFYRRGLTVAEMRSSETARQVCSHAGIPYDDQAAPAGTII